MFVKFLTLSFGILNIILEKSFLIWYYKTTKMTAMQFGLVIRFRSTVSGENPRSFYAINQEVWGKIIYQRTTER